MWKTSRSEWNFPRGVNLIKTRETRARQESEPERSRLFERTLKYGVKKRNKKINEKQKTKRKTLVPRRRAIFFFHSPTDRPGGKRPRDPVMVAASARVHSAIQGPAAQKHLTHFKRHSATSTKKTKNKTENKNSFVFQCQIFYRFAFDVVTISVILGYAVMSEWLKSIARELQVIRRVRTCTNVWDRVMLYVRIG